MMHAPVVRPHRHHAPLASTSSLRRLRIVVGASGRSATVCMVASRVGGSNLTLPKCRSLSTSPWDLEGRCMVPARSSLHGLS